MRLLIAAILLAGFATVSSAECLNCQIRRQNSKLANSWLFSHKGGKPRNLYEGIGYSTRSPGHALANVCYYGKRTMVARNIQWSPHRRGWVATAWFR